MAVTKYLNRAQTVESLKDCLKYCTNKEKTYNKELDRCLVDGIYCTGDFPFEQFMAVKDAYNKTDGRLFYHYVFSYDKDECTRFLCEELHNISIDYAKERFIDMQVLVSTHQDQDNIHSHMVINSVRPTDGYKISSEVYFNPVELIEFNRKFCEKHNLNFVEDDPDKARYLSYGEYYAIEHGFSWKQKLIGIIDEVMETAVCKDDFINKIKQKGYRVDFAKNDKRIMYTTNHYEQITDRKLPEIKYSREEMDRYFLKPDQYIKALGKMMYTLDGNYSISDMLNEVRFKLPDNAYCGPWSDYKFDEMNKKCEIIESNFILCNIEYKREYFTDEMILLVENEYITDETQIKKHSQNYNETVFKLFKRYIPIEGIQNAEEAYQKAKEELKIIEEQKYSKDFLNSKHGFGMSF